MNGPGFKLACLAGAVLAQGDAHVDSTFGTQNRNVISAEEDNVDWLVANASE